MGQRCPRMRRMGTGLRKHTRPRCTRMRGTARSRRLTFLACARAGTRRRARHGLTRLHIALALDAGFLALDRPGNLLRPRNLALADAYLLPHDGTFLDGDALLVNGDADLFAFADARSRGT